MRMQRKPRSFGHVARAASRGVTLIEVMIVVVILSLIADGVTVAVMPKFKQAQIETAENNAREVRNAADRWRATHPGDQCPTDFAARSRQGNRLGLEDRRPVGLGVQDRLRARTMSPCSSPGPDKSEGTADDIRVPKGAAAAGR